MSIYNPGDIVLVKFPFTNLSSSKVRPALVLSIKKEDMIVMGIFSKVPEQLEDSWVIIEENTSCFKQTGLKKRSVVKTEKIAIIHQSVIRKKLGSLPIKVMELIKSTLKSTLEL